MHASIGSFGGLIDFSKSYRSFTKVVPKALASEGDAMVGDACSSVVRVRQTTLVWAALVHVSFKPASISLHQFGDMIRHVPTDTHSLEDAGHISHVGVLCLQFFRCVDGSEIDEISQGAEDRRVAFVVW
jgi:hypothetical protein